MEYAIIMPESKLYVRGFTSFGHAFKHLKRMPGWEESWFIVKEDQFPIVDVIGIPIVFGCWLELDEPCPWKKCGKRRGNPRMAEHQ